MNRHSRMVLAALLGMLAGNVHADSGLYVGGSLGSSHIDEDIGGFDLESDTNAWRLFGGLQLGDILALEAGYLDFGDFSTSAARVSGDGWTLGANLGLPLSDNLSLYGRGGVFFWDADVAINGFSIDTPGDENPYFGGGMKVDVSHQLSVTGDWTRYNLDDLDTDVISIGLQYRFGD